MNEDTRAGHQGHPAGCGLTRGGGLRTGEAYQGVPPGWAGCNGCDFTGAPMDRGRREYPAAQAQERIDFREELEEEEQRDAGDDHDDHDDERDAELTSGSAPRAR